MIRDNQGTIVLQRRADRDLVVLQLKRLLHLPLNRPVVLTSALDAEDAGAVERLARDIAGVPEGARRAPVRLAAEAVRLRRAVSSGAAAGRWPIVRVSTDYGLVNYPADLFPASDEWRTNWTVGVALAIPIFSGFRVTGEIRAAEADVAAAQVQLAELEQLAAVDAADVENRVAVAEEAWRASGGTVRQATRAYQIAEVRYQQGVSTHLELADSRLQLEQARANEARALRDLRIARVRRALLPNLPLGAGP